MTMHVDPYETKVLKEEVHARLVQNLDVYARDAGIQRRWVWTPLAETCGDAEIDYVRKYPTHKAEGAVQGLLYVSASPGVSPKVDERMAAVAGAFVRNFIRARVMTLASVLETLGSDKSVEATVLLIPNFCLSKAEGGDLPTWKAAMVYDLLLQRSNANLHTVLYASSVGEATKTYGTACGRLLDSHFLKVAI